MTAKLPDDYWIEVPGGTYTVGLLPDEAKQLAAESAAHFRKVGPEFSLNMAKSFNRALQWNQQHANPEWVDDYLRVTYPPREVQVAPFAIARMSVTNGLYRQFMRETGEFTGPYQSEEDDEVMRGAPWSAACAFAEWAGARLPFADEWEVGVRGPERRLHGLDWGQDHGDWCCDHWLEAPQEWQRVIRGLELPQLISSAITRTHGDPSDFNGWRHGIRLVRADGRQMPGDHPATPEIARLGVRVRNAELHLVRPTLQSLSASVIGELHRIEVTDDGYYQLDRSDEGAQSVKLEVQRTRPDVQRHGHFLTAVSKETIRRHPREHGVFAWNIHYRYVDGKAFARPAVAHRMAYDRQIHLFLGRFRADEELTPIEELTPELIRQHVLDAFAFYDEYADSDVPPAL